MKHYAIALALLFLQSCATANSSAPNKDWLQTFDVRAVDLASVGRNPYFVLEPGYQMTFEGDDDGATATLVITVLNETKRVDGVETRIVEERESTGGKLKEVSRNYFAIDRNTHDVYYFGEDVDMYNDGKVSGHGGRWLSGQNGAHFGLFMPGTPRVGQKFYQEVAPKMALDRCEIVSVTGKLKVPAGEFDRCVEVAESTPLEPGHIERKVYGPGAGLLTDGELKLTKYGMPGR